MGKAREEEDDGVQFMELNWIRTSVLSMATRLHLESSPTDLKGCHFI